MQFNIAASAERLSFLNKHFKDGFIDLVVFKAAQHFIQDYKGCRWDFCLSENGTPFMIPTGQETYNVRGLTVDNTLAGLLMTYSVLLGKTQDGMAGLTKQLRDLKEVLADYCIELNRSDVLEALLH